MADQDEAGGKERYEETKRAARVLDIIQHISLAPKLWTRRRLAEKYERSERQIQRDLDVIRHGLRLDLRHAPDGYYFASIPRLPVASYTLSEALSLILAAQAARRFGVSSEDLASAVSRLESVFPDTFRPLLRDIFRDDSLPSAASTFQGRLMLLNEALGQRRKVRMLYAVAERQGEITDRVVHPYCLLPDRRSWYLVGHCELRSEVRMLKVDRVLELELLPEHYCIPEDFSLSQAMGSAWGLMWGAAGEPERVRLAFSPEAGRWVAEDEWHPSQEVEVREDGRYQVRFEMGVTPEFVRWLLWYGRDVQVLEPAWLRQRVAEEHRAASEMQ